MCQALVCAWQRRCYWLLDGDDNVVLVHYLSSIPHANRAMVHSASSGEGLGAVSLNAVQAPPPQQVRHAACMGLLGYDVDIAIARPCMLVPHLWHAMSDCPA